MNHDIEITQPQYNQYMQLLLDHYEHLCNPDALPSERTQTQKMYDTAITAFGAFVAGQETMIPSKLHAEKWREKMVEDGKLSVSTINARLSAIRALFRSIAEDTTDPDLERICQKVASIKNAKEKVFQDKLDDDYGIRLSIKELQGYVSRYNPPKPTLTDLRDRALICVLAGTGLRVSEAVRLNVRDVLLSNMDKKRGIRVRQGKGNKQRLVVLDDWNSWVVEAVEQWLESIGIQTSDLRNSADLDKPVFTAFNHDINKGNTRHTGQRLSKRTAQHIIKKHHAPHKGKYIQMKAHDLRRTYAKLCRDAGMSWEALRDNLGHADLKTTQLYVGTTTNAGDRMPKWTINIHTTHREREIKAIAKLKTNED